MFTLALASTLSLDGTADDGTFDQVRLPFGCCSLRLLPLHARNERTAPPMWAIVRHLTFSQQSGQPSLMDKYEYVMYGGRRAPLLNVAPHASALSAQLMRVCSYERAGKIFRVNEDRSTTPPRLCVLFPDHSPRQMSGRFAPEAHLANHITGRCLRRSGGS